MKNTYHKNIQYQEAQKLFKERKNYLLFSVGFLILVSMFQLEIIDYKHLNFGFTIVHKDFFFWLQGMVLVLYGIYLFVPYFHQWEKKKVNELMKKNRISDAN